MASRGVCLVLFLASLTPAVECLVGGVNSNIGVWTFMGSLRYPGNNHICGVVLGHRNWVLTSGHCVGDSGFTMEFGHVFRNAGFVYSYDTVTRHPDYGMGSGYYPNDIALIHVPDGGVDIEQLFIKPVPGFDSGTNQEGLSCYTTGWGATMDGGMATNQLQEAVTPVISDAVCSNQWLTAFNPEDHICAWNSTSEDVGLCNFDEGGPLICDNEGVWQLVGLASYFGSGCQTAYPSVYVRISAYGEWVCDATGMELCW